MLFCRGQLTGASSCEPQLFGQPPDGWETEGEGQFGDPTEPGSFQVEPLRELVVGVRYAASGYTRLRSFPVGFTTADLDRLEDGQVITADGYDEFRTMPYDAYPRQARDSRGECAPR